MRQQEAIKERPFYSVYEIRGCYGSQKLVEVESMLDAKTAKQHARARNQRRADGSGMSLRAWMKEKSSNPEGVCFSGRSGKDGYRYEVWSQEVNETV